MPGRKRPARFWHAEMRVEIPMRDAIAYGQEMLGEDEALVSEHLARRLQVGAVQARVSGKGGGRVASDDVHWDPESGRISIGAAVVNLLIIDNDQCSEGAREGAIEVSPAEIADQNIWVGWWEWRKYLEELRPQSTALSAAGAYPKSKAGRPPIHDAAEISAVAAIEINEAGFPEGFSEAEFMRRVKIRLQQDFNYADDPEGDQKPMPADSWFKEHIGSWMKVFRLQYGIGANN